jgi:tRNA A58 N-methylase Trm61
MDVFEFGSGNSSLYFAGKASTVHSVEHDKDWFSTIKEQLPPNAKITFSESMEEYESVIVKESKKFNIVIVDGIRRNECLKVALECLTADGVIILDDSNRSEYEQGREVVQAEGFKQLDFWGVGPGSIEFKSTTIYYRAGNCLNI